MAGVYSQKPWADNVSDVNVLSLSGVVATVGTPTVTIKEIATTGDVSYAIGATVPSNGDAGYATGCFFKKIAGNGQGTTLYLNEGSSTSALFSPVDTNAGGAAGTQSLKVAHAVYSFGTDGGAVGPITPALNATIPANAILVAATANSTTAVTSGGAATVSIGTTAGSSATSILGSTAKTSFTTDALINGVPTFASPVKTSAPGQIQLTVGTAALTAGVIEVFVSYYVAQNA